MDTPTLAITACDSYEGRLLAEALATHLEEQYFQNSLQDSFNGSLPQLICLARDIEKVGDIKERPVCKVIQINYDHPESLTIALRGTQTVVLVPEIEPQREEWANNLVDAMVQEKVLRCIVISSIGTDAKDKDQLRRFSTVEDKVKGSIQRWTILREGFPFQALFYWAEMVQKEGILGMTIRQDIEFAPLDIANLGDALVAVMFPSATDHQQVYDEDREGDNRKVCNITKPITADLTGLVEPTGGTDRFDGQIYTLTGPETVTGPKLADELTRALKQKGCSSADDDNIPLPINYKIIDRNTLKEYLCRLRKPHKSEYFRIIATDIPGISCALRLFQQAANFAFGVRAHKPSFDSMLPVSSSVLRGEEQWKGDGYGDEGGKNVKKDYKEPCGLPGCSNGTDDSERNHKELKKPECRRPRLDPPNDTEVSLILQLLDYISEGHAKFQSGDLKKVAGIRGCNAKQFFEKYALDFRGRPT
ncbi:hypothetical protein BCR41DRAFT_134375 [Lobosporangium transversale]|uniref:NAD(P)-binding domain-containing protein n=1 Tax=Lobosporangium transversale TaxID=64571 RepID=A0A1Y2GJY0_9FUNG|nr:hypothetical protein BCR41DRAFT_134375 [Lobosporangium transversale]ORZ09674.1 hypothetical protein BCR41DRAFT_134375 [Lobosporangium transversale]|eukprot:XP_021878944.1 hypothetical protein BCR41DRAFT_134375 [Lobosporangium transversale]